jgi:hypothetical protein
MAGRCTSLFKTLFISVLLISFAAAIAILGRQTLFYYFTLTLKIVNKLHISVSEHVFLYLGLDINVLVNGPAFVSKYIAR